MPVINELINAIQDENLERIEELLMQNSSPNRNGGNAIKDEIRQILFANDFANAPCTEMHLLCYAASEGYNVLVAWLLDHGVDPNTFDMEVTPPLHLAALRGHYDIVKLLLKHEAALNWLDGSMGVRNNFCHTALHLAIYENHTNIVELLLNSGADPSIENSMLETPLHAAAEEGNEEIVRMLLKCESEYEVDIDAQSVNGHTPLHKAAHAGNENIVAQLLDQGASINLQDEDRETPLYHAVRQNHEAVVTLLLEKGANPNIPSEHATPLYTAAFLGSQTMVFSLLNAGASVNFRHRGQEAIHAAAMQGHETIVETLLSHGASIHLPNQRGETALRLALQEEHLETAQLLLRQGAYSYRDGKTEENISAYWEEAFIDTETERKFYTMLLLAGVRVPDNQVLPEPLTRIQKILKATVQEWLAPFDLSELYQQVIPDVLRAFPRLLRWAKAVQIFEEEQANYTSVKDILLISESENEHLDENRLLNRKAVLERLKANILPKELLLVIRSVIIQQALVTTLVQCYPLPRKIADYMAAKAIADPSACRLFYDTLFESAQITACEPALTPAI